MQKNDLYLNPVQKVIHNFSYHVKLLKFLAGRGTGKSSKGIGTVIRNIIHFLPRSKWMIIAESYRSMLENTLPSTIRALEDYGYYRNVHYVVGVEPPKHYATPYEPNLKGFKNTITFWNGTSFLLVSQDASATSPRGLNTDGAIVDEALNLDKDHYDAEIAPTIRANKMNFSGVPFHHGEFFFSSMPYGSDAEWLTNSIEYYLKDGKDMRAMMETLISLQMDFLEEPNISHKEKIWHQINEHRKKIIWYPNKVDRINTLYVESNAFDNIRILGYDYIYKLYKTTGYVKFMTEIMNKRMLKPEGGFYPKFDRNIHAYKRLHFGNESLDDIDLLSDLVGDDINLNKLTERHSGYDMDCFIHEPLILGVDFGANINCAVVCQHITAFNQFNFINDFYVKSPDMLDELARDIAEYYRYHQNKYIDFYYDRNGNVSQANSKLTMAEQFAQILESQGWTVNKRTTGLNPFHMQKYRLWNILLSDGKGLPSVKLNYYNCQDLITSMEGCKTKHGKHGWEKDKTGEGKDLETEERQPHLSDAADYIVYPIFKHLLDKRSSFIETTVR